MNRRKVIEMPPPQVVRRRVDALRRLEPPIGLLDDVLREVDATAQVRPPSRFRVVSGLAMAAGLAAAVIGGGIFIGQLPDAGGPGPSPSATPTVAPSDGGSPPTPVPIDELPPAGTLEAVTPIPAGAVLTLGAFEVAWLADPGNGTVARLDPEVKQVSAGFRVRAAGQLGRLWLAATDDGTLWAGVGGTIGLAGFDPGTGELVAELALGVDPWWIAAGSGEIWLTDMERNLLIGVDAATATELHRIEIARPTGIAVGRDTVWVVSSETNEAIEIDRAAGTILRQIDVGPTPMQAHLAPDGRDLFVLGRDGMPVSAIDLEAGVVRRGTKELTALAFVDGEPWGLIPSGLLVGPLDPETLEFIAALQLPTGFGEGLVSAGGSIWTIDAENAFRVSPSQGIESRR